MFYGASGIHPDATLMTVNMQPVTAEEYLYWLAYDCDYLSSYMGTVDFDAAVSESMSFGQYAMEDAQRTARRSKSSEAGTMLIAGPPFGTTLGGSEKSRAGVSATRQSHGEDDAASQALALLDGTPVGIHGKRRYIEAIHEPVKAHDALAVEAGLAVRL